MEFKRSLVWHLATRGMKIKLQPSAGDFTKPTRENLRKVVSAIMQTCKACTLYNERKSTTPDEHPKELHIYSYCLVAAKRQCAHHKRFCRRKTYDGAKK